MLKDLSHLRILLLPFSWLYCGVVGFRNKLFDCNIIESRRYDIPIINIGNITVGGTGKTPHVEYLIRLLSKDYQVAVLSRGYKRKSKGYFLAKNDSALAEIGDEPWQMNQKYKKTHVAVDGNRRRGIEHIIRDDDSKDTQVIVLDDAYQHRYVHPGMNILLVDYNRMVTSDTVLPAGNLREPAHEKKRADIVIVTKCPSDMTPLEFSVLRQELGLKPFQKLYFTSFQYKKLKALFNDTEHTLDELKDKNILLVTGIGNPKQMEDELKTYITSITTVTFPDHHYFNDSDIGRIKDSFRKLEEPRFIITTEKDSGRLKIAGILDSEVKESILVLPIEVRFLQNNENNFNQTILNYVQRNS